MVAALSVRQVEGELTTLTSRGASISQLFQMQIFEAILICITAFIFGPLIAYGLVWSYARIGPISDVSQLDWMVSLPTASWIAAGISVLACFTALLIPVIPILRSSVVQHRRNIARRTKKTWWHRYYIDVLLLVIGLVALWRLSLYGSISGTDGGSIDWLILLAPLALLIGSATVLLRLFPSIFRVLANLAARGRGLTAALAFWQTSRDPTHVTRLVLLFTLAMALGILAIGLNATLSLSEKERARYSTGGEARLSYESFIPLSSFNSMPQVTSASAVWRGSGRTNVRSYRNMPDFSLLAIDPLSFATVSQHRTDFTDDSIPAIFSYSTVPKNGQIGDHRELLMAGQPLTFEIRGIIADFPTLASDFLIVNLATFEAVAGSSISAQLYKPEVWVSTEGQNHDQIASLPFIANAVLADAKKILNIIRSNILTLGTVRAFGLDAFILATISLVGLILANYFSFRQPAYEFSILCAFGLSRNQSNQLLIGEGILVLGLGLFSGLLLGFSLTRLMRPYISLAVSRTLPGMMVHQININWQSVAFITGLLTISYGLAAGLIIFTLWKTDVHRILRIGDE